MRHETTKVCCRERKGMVIEVIRSRDKLVTDDHGKEISEERVSAFNLVANDGDIQKYAMGYIPSHWHKELEFFVLSEGCVQIRAEGRIYELTAGEGCFINSEVIHSFLAGSENSCHFRSFVFGAEVIGGMPGTVFDTEYVRPLLKEGVPFLRFQKEDRRYFEEFDRAFAACISEKEGYEFEVRNALSNILLFIRTKSGSQIRTIAPAQEMHLKNMLLWIEDHLSSNICVVEIAKSANICTRECQRIFNRYLHDSPIEYVLKKRIFHAAELLSYTDKSITEIAFCCGFSSPSYFSKRFREWIGHSPNEYRKIQKGD